MASAAGLLNQIGDAAYSTTKHAAVGFAESLSVTHGRDGIKVSVICPQYVATPMVGYGDDAPAAESETVISPETLADSVVKGIEEEAFLILPHPVVADYMAFKTANYDRWLAGMRKLRGNIIEQVGTTDLAAMLGWSEQMGIRISHVRLGDREIAYRHDSRAHPGDAAAVVLIHGAGCSSQDWPESWFDSRAGDLTGYAVYAPDLPGHGASGGELITDIPSMGDLVSAFIDRLGLKRVCLVGHSMGSAIAIASALGKRPQLERLVLIAGAACFDVQQGLIDGLISDFDLTASKIAEASWHGATDTSLRDRTMRSMQAAGQRTLLNDFSSCRAVNLTEHVSDIPLPVLAIAASKDRLVKLKSIQDMCMRMDRSRIETYDDGGHFLHLEKPQQIAELIARFAS